MRGGLIVCFVASLRTGFAAGVAFAGGRCMAVSTMCGAPADLLTTGEGRPAPRKEETAGADAALSDEGVSGANATSCGLRARAIAPPRTARTSPLVISAVWRELIGFRGFCRMR